MPPCAYCKKNEEYSDYAGIPCCYSCWIKFTFPKEEALDKLKRLEDKDENTHMR